MIFVMFCSPKKTQIDKPKRNKFYFRNGLMISLAALSKLI